MREILFKAKRIDNGEWVEGYYLRDQYHRGGKDIIFYRKDSDRFTVYTDIIDIETLCQFTGLCDKNGKKIWENDILRFTQQDETKIGVIKYNAPIFTYFGLMRWSLYKDEVIGNIFDNPELLQEEHK
jgi:uncharacterized phage protein (TIGR01671 family)